MKKRTKIWLASWLSGVLLLPLLCYIIFGYLASVFIATFSHAAVSEEAKT